MVGPMSDEPLLLTGTGRLLMAQVHAADPPAVLTPWAVLVRHGRVAWVGSPEAAPATDRWEDLGGALVTPGLVDAHTHPVFAGDRSDETAARLAGQAYAAGGILRTVASTREASDDTLEALVVERFEAALDSGTTTLEAKSGYGLTIADELRSLRIIRAAAERVGIRVVRTFLGAHAVPPEAASADDHVEEVIHNMLPAVAEQAEFVDVFCDRGFFTPEQAERVLAAARGHGMALKLHAEQLARTGAAELGVRLGAVSVDHLEHLDADGVRAVAASSTVATLLPGPSVLQRDHLPPARALLDGGATVALASDANAGTYANPSMPLVIGLGAATLGMTVDEAVAAATAGGAAAIGLSTEVGIIREGMAADLVAWDAEHEGAFALRMGDVGPLRIWIGGEERGHGSL
jgi:imidazolonepropionase